MKTFLVLGSLVLALNSVAQDAAPRAADPAKFVARYEKAKKLDLKISAERAAADRKILDDVALLNGLGQELNAEMKRECGDVPQGCRYDEKLRLLVPLPKPAEPPKAEAPKPEAPKQETPK